MCPHVYAQAKVTPGDGAPQRLNIHTVTNGGVDFMGMGIH